MSDPVKLLNAYGWMLCGQCAEVLQGLYEAAGMPARIQGLPAHNVCEVFYDGRWHVFDVDMWTWFRTPEGHIASASELAQNARALIVENRNRSVPCGVPDRTLEDYARMYDEAKASIRNDELTTAFPRWATRAHTMDSRCAPAKRWCGPKGIRNASTCRSRGGSSWRARRDASGAASHGSATSPPTVGNGRWTYAPDLSARTRDVELGVWSRQGLTQDAQGLVGPGQAVFRIQSPYPFCGIPDERQTPYAYSNGVWLSLAGEGAVAADVTDREGRFVAAASADGAFSANTDITALLEARYETRVRITLAEGARLSKFVFDGHVMTAPCSLPRLVAGRNRMELRMLDKHRKRTTPWTIPADFRSESALKTHLVRLEGGTLAPGKRERLQIAPVGGGARAVFRFDAPEGRPFAWAYAIATVPEGPTNAAPKQATLEWSPDGAAWTPFARIAIPNTPFQWDASIDGELVPAHASQTSEVYGVWRTSAPNLRFNSSARERSFSRSSMRGAGGAHMRSDRLSQKTGGTTKSHGNAFVARPAGSRVSSPVLKKGLDGPLIAPGNVQDRPGRFPPLFSSAGGPIPPPRPRGGGGSRGYRYPRG